MMGGGAKGTPFAWVVGRAEGSWGAFNSVYPQVLHAWREAAGAQLAIHPPDPMGETRMSSDVQLLQDEWETRPTEPTVTWACNVLRVHPMDVAERPRVHRAVEAFRASIGAV
jgi:hypothetical protein